MKIAKNLCWGEECDLQFAYTLLYYLLWVWALILLNTVYIFCDKIVVDIDQLMHYNTVHDLLAMTRQHRSKVGNRIIV
jgi:hypothetical protein